MFGSWLLVVVMLYEGNGVAMHTQGSYSDRMICERIALDIEAAFPSQPRAIARCVNTGRK